MKQACHQCQSWSICKLLPDGEGYDLSRGQCLHYNIETLRYDHCEHFSPKEQDPSPNTIPPADEPADGAVRPSEIAPDEAANAANGKRRVRFRMPKTAATSINPKSGGAPEKDGAVPLDDLADSSKEAKEKAIRELQPIEKIRLYLDENYIFRRNTLKNIVEFLPMGSDVRQWTPFEDKQFNDLVIQLEILGFRAPEKRVEKLLGSSMIADYNAITDYFDRVGESAAAGASEFERLCQCVSLSPLDIQIGAYDYPMLFRYYFFKWLQACYLCGVGKKHNDVMFTLIGAQGRRKTTFLEKLTPRALAEYSYCGKIDTSASSFEVKQLLSDKFMINIDDQLETIFGKDYNSLKSIISSSSTSYRERYARMTRKHARIANFCGSVNESRFLRDSNNRRYLCFQIDDIDGDALGRIDMDRVWAEVKHAADSSGMMFPFTMEDINNIDLMNRYFEAPTEECEALNEIFSPAADSDLAAYPADCYNLSFSEILYVLRCHTGNNQLKNYNLQTAMRKYQYQSRPARRGGGNPAYLYPVRLVRDDQGLRNVIDRLVNL